MKKWCEKQKEDGEQDCEQIWQTWLETHNAIAEEAVGRSKEKKKREWLKGEWDQGIFEAIREKNKLKREMSTKSGEERKKIVRQYTSFKNLVKRIINAKKKRKREEINEKLERFRGKDEKQYWRYLKNLAGIEKNKKGYLRQCKWERGWKMEKREKRFGMKLLII